MTTAEQAKLKAKQERIDALRHSSLHGLRPLRENELISIGDIEIDRTNPGSLTESHRYERREESMLDSYDILERVVYPIVVCENPDEDGDGKYIHIDGYGRLGMLKAKGEKQVRAIVYPPLNLEQRICFRQTLNAAQEPFDAVSIIHDLKLLAKERGLSLQSRADIKVLVRDLPARVQAREKDLLVLSRWHPDVVEKMGEQSGPQQEVIGLDQLRGLDRLLSSIEKEHPHVTEKKGGVLEVSNLLGQGFYNQRFADGMRSQEGIRKAIKAVKTVAGDHPAVEEFLSGDIGLRALIRQGEERLQEQVASNDKVVTIIEACQTLASLLIEVDANSLSEAECRALERTHRVLESVIPS